MYRAFWVIIVCVMAISCTKESAYTELLIEDYPELYAHAFTRNADSISTFTDHPKEHVREQAWRALISTPIEDMDGFITKVQYDGSFVAWAALSAHEITDDQISRLHDLWLKRASLRDGISLVLGRQGNQESLDFLTRNFDKIIDSDHEYESALAIGRLMADYNISDITKRSILKYGAVIEDSQLFRAYFYGLYRSREGVENEEMQRAIWETYDWTLSPRIKQYALRISFNSNAEETFDQLNIENTAEMHVQLAVELAQHTGNLNWNDKLAKLFGHLLDHTNPVVNEVALSQIKNHLDKPQDFDETIQSKVVENEEKEASIRLSGIEALSETAGYLELTDSLAVGEEYLLIKKLNIYEQALNEDEFLEMLTEYISSQNQLEVLFAAQALSEWWGHLSSEQKTSTRIERVRSLIFELLEKGNRSVTYVTVSFIQSSELVGKNDFGRIVEYLTRYELPEDVEVYQVFGELLKDRFEAESTAIIDSLARKGNRALNNSLMEMGWDIPEVETSSPDFRQPNWRRLAEMKYEPIWVLETQKGIVKIAMNVLSAPATISGIDSLTRAGAYDDVAFHRVVPNFVIQGGDVETGDGFGGPDYTVPTEASEREFRRGTVGIASAGTDTEGSQYFVMHQWAPHLNGRYTIIGEVVEGMEVVDRILVGDKVVQAYWQNEQVD